MNKLYLYRLKVIDKSQLTLFNTPEDRTSFVEEIILSKPSHELRKGYFWHIGNIDNLKPTGLLFAIGRTTKTSREKYDSKTGDFIEIQGEESPFTYVVYDTHYSIIGIAPKSKLAPKTTSIARQLAKLLNNHSSVANQGIKIDIDEISDPETFLHYIRTAYQVTSFTAEFGNPNPWDVEEDFQKPMENYLDEVGGSNGKTTVKGEDLDRDKIENVTRSVASTGNNAKANLKHSEKQKSVQKTLKGDIVQIFFDEDDKDEYGLIKRIRDAYEKIRK